MLWAHGMAAVGAGRVAVGIAWEAMAMLGAWCGYGRQTALWLQCMGGTMAQWRWLWLQ